MVKLLGVLLVWCGCAMLGLRAAHGLRGRVRLLEDMGQALELMERELLLNRAALPELLERLSNRATQQGGSVFRLCKANMQAGRDFACAWALALEQSGLKEEEHAILACLAQVLGRYDAQGQGEAMAQIRKELERLLEHRAEETRSLGKVYCMLGITVGGFLSVSLL